MRLFVAAEIAESVRGGLEMLLADLRRTSLPVRWVGADGIHVTLKFLGETGPEREPPIREAVGLAARGSGPFILEAAGVGTFPECGAPRVVWAGLRGDLDAATRLHAALERALAPLGFPKEVRPFRPHLTLGRAREGGRGAWRAALESHREDRFGSFRVTECVLFESHLGAAGATYEARGRFPLSGGPTGMTA